MRRTSYKGTRINAEVQKELSRIISREIKDPRIHELTSVTHVMVTQDLKECKVYVSVLGDSRACEDTLAGLQSASGFIRRELAGSMNLRNTPELHFLPDTSIAYAIDMSKKIDDVIQKQEEQNTDGE